jgi:predicted CopG family antitoxin
MQPINDYNTLINFIKDNPDTYAELLKESPYYVHVKDVPYHENWKMFGYSQFESDFENPIVRCSRGSVFEIVGSTVKPICLPFYKFSNYTEKGEDEIDWTSAQIQLKVDGGLKKCVKIDGKIYWFTNKGFTDAPLYQDISLYDEEKSRGCKTYQDLINIAMQGNETWLDTIPENVTFLFELTSPRDKIIISYEETKLWFLGARDNKTFKEFDRMDAITKFNIPFDYPPIIDCKTSIESLDEILTTWKGDKEGVVVCDNNFRRIKIKCNAYRQLKFIKGADSFSDRAIFNMLKEGNIDDAIVAFPEIKEEVELVKKIYRKFISNIENKLNDFNEIYASFMHGTITNCKRDYVFYTKKYYKDDFSLAMIATKSSAWDKYFDSLEWKDFRDFFEKEKAKYNV